jgi:hypothetical protein
VRRLRRHEAVFAAGVVSVGNATEGVDVAQEESPDGAVFGVGFGDSFADEELLLRCGGGSVFGLRISCCKQADGRDENLGSPGNGRGRVHFWLK